MQEEILTEVFAKAVIIIDDEASIVFVDHTKYPAASMLFLTDKQLDNYLLSRYDVDTWEIENARSGDIFYKRRCVFGDLDSFTTEKRLRYAIAGETNGVWQQEDISIPKVKRDKFVFQQLNYCSTEYLVTNSEGKIKSLIVSQQESQAVKTQFFSALFSIMLMSNSIIRTIPRTIQNSADSSEQAEPVMTEEDINLRPPQRAWSSLMPLIVCNLFARISGNNGHDQSSLFKTSACFFATNVPVALADDQCELNAEKCNMNTGEFINNVAWNGATCAAGVAATGIGAVVALEAGAICALGTAGAAISNQILGYDDCMEEAKKAQRSCIEDHYDHSAQMSLMHKPK